VRTEWRGKVVGRAS